MLNYIDSSWSFKEFVDNIEAVKNRTEGIIASFSCFDIKKQIRFKRQLRNKIYSFKFEEWKKDRLIECIYNYFDIEELKAMNK